MSKIIITGATSFIGANLVRKLLNEDHKVLAVIRKSSKKSNILGANKNLKIIELNMNEYNKFNLIIKEQYDVFISLAWNGTRGQDRENKDIQFNNYQNSLDGIKSAINLGCKKIILAGSQAEYGKHSIIISEKSECHPETQYGKYKLKLFQDANELCKKYNVSCIEPRFFSLYGPGDNEATMIISILKKMINNQDCELTSCEQFWNFMYINDAIEALYLLIKNKSVNGIYNFGSNDTRKLKLFIYQMQEITNSKSRLLFGKIDTPQNKLNNVMPDITKLTTTLQWSPPTSFDDGIKNIVNKLHDRGNL